MDFVTPGGLEQKSADLRGIISRMERVLVAFSGGVDSTLLLKLCSDILGERVLAVTAVSETLANDEEADAKRLAAEIGVEHLLVPVSELTDERFVSNPPERCYHCKLLRYGKLLDIARDRGIRWVIDGANADDSNDYRPGMKAAQELGVRSPLQEAGFTKQDIRRLSAAYGLSTADKPAYACLASRVPYGCVITAEKLRQIDAAESYLRSLGIRQVRVRHCGDTARIEVPADRVATLASAELAPLVVAKLKEIGFTYVALDLQGYRTGSLNDTLTSRES